MTKTRVLAIAKKQKTVYGGATLRPAVNDGRDNSESAVRLIQITDCHLGAQNNDELLGLNTDESLDDVLGLIAREQSKFDAMVCTGDIASSAEDGCYQRFVDHVHRYFSVPLGWLPGNHDSARVMRESAVTPKPESRVMRLGNWHIILLDSSVPGHVHGDLAPAELAFLARSLAAVGEREYALVMLHHQPVAVGSTWIDQYILRNADAFFALVDDCPAVKIVSWGHVHQDFSAERNGVQLLATPATSIQFKPRSDDFALDQAQPGYRWFELAGDGAFSTGVSRVMDKVYPIDLQSAGY